VISSASSDSERTLTEDDGKTSHAKIVYVTFSEKDPQNPYNYSRIRKWILVGAGAAMYSFVTAVNATAYPLGSLTMMRDLNCTNLQVQLGNTAYLLSCAFAPMCLAPLSEQFGRLYLFLGSHLIYTLCFIPQALAPNVWWFVGFRVLQGAAGSAGNSITGGIVSDLFRAEERSLPMSLFAVLIMLGQALGGLFGWVDLTIGFRWISWINLIFCSVHFVIMLFVFTETRGLAILQKRANRLTRSTGILHQVAEDESKPKPTITHLISKSVKRPFILLLSEPIVTAFSLYVAFLWGLVVSVKRLEVWHITHEACSLAPCSSWLLQASGSSLRNMDGTEDCKALASSQLALDQSLGLSSIDTKIGCMLAMRGSRR